MKYSVLCTICARGGSKGVNNKNIKVINNKPLIAYTIEQAKQTGLFEHIVISTDSDKIAKCAVSYGGEVIFNRPEELATDTAPKIPVIRHAFLEAEKYYTKKFDYLIDLDATSPLRLSDDITNAFTQFLRNGNENLITAMPARRSPYFNMVEISDNGTVQLSKKLDKSIVRRQDAPKCYDMNASIYIWKRDVILNNDSIFLDKTGLYIMPEERSIDIDSELDFEFVEFLLGKNKGK